MTQGMRTALRKIFARRDGLQRLPDEAADQLLLGDDGAKPMSFTNQFTNQ